MSENPEDRDADQRNRLELLMKQIKDRLSWAIFFLVCITLNTCEMTDKLSDAVR